MPRHPTSSTSTRFTGKLNMRRTIESRTLRERHEDVHWCNKLNQHANSFVLEVSKLLGGPDGTCTMNEADRPPLGGIASQSLDDKSKAACGEPGKPVDSGVRAPKASLAAADVQAKSSDHNFHRVSITPAVTLLQDIPDGVSASWRRGSLCVVVRDSVFFGSNGFCHAAELLKLLKQQSKEGALPFVLRIKTDGGPDHNVSAKTASFGGLLGLVVWQCSDSFFCNLLAMAQARQHVGSPFAHRTTARGRLRCTCRSPARAPLVVPKRSRGMHGSPQPRFAALASGA